MGNFEEKNPLISVVIPTFQHAQTIRACIDSVLSQSYQNLEIIIVDDGSTDNTQEVLKEYGDRIHSVYQANKGSNPARNRGFREASGEFVIFVDADITMTTEMIHKMYQVFNKESDVSFVYSSFKFGWKTFRSMAFDASALRKMNFVHTTSLVRTKDFPGFDDDIRRLQDWDVWLTMVEEGKSGIWIDEILFSVEIAGASRIGSSWLPSFMYKVPWHMIGWKPMQIRKYESARKIIQDKHGL